MGVLKVAVAGAGYFARLHHDAWSRVPGVVLAGISDINEAAARAAGEAAGVPHFTDMTAMLDEVQSDLVDIVTPPSSHLPLIRVAMQRGIPVICQKPFCASQEEAREAVELSRQAGKFICVHENFRFQPWYRKVKELLDQGALGQVYQITFRLRPGDGQGPDAYLSRQPYFQKMERFLVHETGVHWIDTFRYLAGNPSAVFADLRRLNPVIAGEDAGLMIFDMPGGVRGVLDCNRLVDHAASNLRRTMGELLVEGSAASLRLDGEGRLLLRSHGVVEETEIPFSFKDTAFGGDCVFNLCNHVVRHMVDGSPLENEAADYLVVQAVERACYASAENRCWVDVASCD
ncbi:MAG: Gfo/Idh/MocA family oxidoreductase [Anderseniella sp.]|jgi:predicted dehydrogenase|nr:Gfo/Idh/MocA family oxidoreductase [Anderseniella sp.]